MAFENRGLDLPFVAAEDLTSAQYHFVELNSSGEMLAAAGSTGAYALGILQNAPALGKEGSVRVDGVSKVAMGETSIYGVTGIAPNTFLSPDDDGRGVGTTGMGYVPKYTKARMLDSTMEYDELSTVEIQSTNPS